MLFFAVLLLLLAAFYMALLTAAGIGFVRTGEASSADAPVGTVEESLPRVTVVIPARNEERTIAACLRSVLTNDYPRRLVEILVVDDASTDRTATVAEPFCRPADATRLIRIAHDSARRYGHKKYALERGVSEATGEIILTTDADCVVAPSWIRSMVSRFDDETGMVTGPVFYRTNGTLFGKLQSLEFLGLVALGGGFVGIGRPHLCNSANLAYRRRAYEEIGGYDGLEDVSTGDDEMLLHRMAYDGGWKIRTCMDASAAVETNPNETAAEFFAQRKRWASAHARYPHLRLTVTSMLCYLFYAALAGSFMGALAAPGMVGPFAAAMVVKISAEASVLVPAALRFRRLDLLPLLLPAQLAQVPYILIIGIAGTLGGYEWKGRRLAK